MKIDKDGTGMISVKELKDAIVEAAIPITDKDFEQIFEEVEYKGSKKINYTEFLAATISVKKFLT
jgi:Ca2+-binding EF-hand superfamily protein